MTMLAGAGAGGTAGTSGKRSWLSALAFHLHGFCLPTAEKQADTPGDPALRLVAQGIPDGLSGASVLRSPPPALWGKAEVPSLG